MNSLLSLDSVLSLQLAITLLHFLWQGLALAIIVAICNVTIARKSAAAKYAVSFSALMLMLVCVLATFGVVVAQTDPIPGLATLEANTLAENITPVLPAGGIALGPATAVDDAEFATALPPATTFDHAQVAPVETTFWEAWAWLAPYVVVVYLIGVVLMAIRLAVAFYGGDRLRRGATVVTDSQWLGRLDACVHQIKCSIRPALMTCDRIATPVIVGVFKPVILLPASLLTELAPAQIEAILLHELAHLRRLDHVANLIQRVVETLLFFHPAVWYVSGRVSAERENCCDDLVLSIGAEPTGYAETLLRVAELGQRRNRLAAATLAVGGGRKTQLRTRVSRVMGVEDETPFRSSRFAAVAVLFFLALVSTGLWSQLQAGASSMTAQGDETEMNENEGPQNLKADGISTMPLMTGNLEALGENEIPMPAMETHFWSKHKIRIDKPHDWVTGRDRLPDFQNVIAFEQPNNQWKGTTLATMYVRASDKTKGVVSGLTTGSDRPKKSTAYEWFEIDGKPARLISYHIPSGSTKPATAEMAIVQYVRDGVSYTLTFVFPIKHRNMRLRMVKRIAKSLRVAVEDDATSAFGSPVDGFQVSLVQDDGAWEANQPSPMFRLKLKANRSCQMNDLLEGCKVEIDRETFVLQESPIETGEIGQVLLDTDPAQPAPDEHEFQFLLFKGDDGWRTKRSADQTGRELLLVKVASENGLAMKLNQDKQPTLKPSQHTIRVGFPLYVIDQMPDITKPAEPIERLTGYAYSNPVSVTIDGPLGAGNTLEPFEPVNDVKVHLNDWDNQRFRSVAMLQSTLRIASITNESQQNLEVFRQGDLGWLEIDGVVYRYNGRVQGKATQLPPGTKVDSWEVELLDPNWQDKDGNRLRWNDGSHEVRYAVKLSKRGDSQQYGAWSNKIGLAGSLFKGKFSQQGKLANQAKVSLVGLGNYPDGSEDWTPTGVKLAAPLFDQTGFDIRSKNLPKTKAIEMFFQIDGLKDKQAVELQHRAEPEHEVYWGGRKFKESKLAANIKSLVIVVPESAHFATVELWINDQGQLQIKYKTRHWSQLQIADGWTDEGPPTSHVRFSEISLVGHDVAPEVDTPIGSRDGGVLLTTPSANRGPVYDGKQMPQVNAPPTKLGVPQQKAGGDPTVHKHKLLVPTSMRALNAAWFDKEDERLQFAPLQELQFRFDDGNTGVLMTPEASVGHLDLATGEIKRMRDDLPSDGAAAKKMASRFQLKVQLERELGNPMYRIAGVDTFLGSTKSDIGDRSNWKRVVTQTPRQAMQEIHDIRWGVIRDQLGDPDAWKKAIANNDFKFNPATDLPLTVTFINDQVSGWLRIDDYDAKTGQLQMRLHRLQAKPSKVEVARNKYFILSETRIDDSNSYFHTEVLEPDAQGGIGVAIEVAKIGASRGFKFFSKLSEDADGDQILIRFSKVRPEKSNDAAKKSMGIADLLELDRQNRANKE